MPGFSGTGPTGRGPRTGRGLGPCGPSKGKKTGRRPRLGLIGKGGRGRRRRFGPTGMMGPGFLRGPRF
jgi:hypothetical protein